MAIAIRKNKSRQPPSGVKQKIPLAALALILLAFVIDSQGTTQWVQTTSETRNAASTQANTDIYHYEPPRSPIIAYATQGPAAQFALIRDRFAAAFPEDTYRLFYHSFDEDCEGCLFQKNDEDCEGCLFQKKTSFAQGKNIIIKAIVRSEDFDRIKYVASFDSDAPLFLYSRKQGSTDDEHNGWQPFHKLLLDPNTVHPFIKPRYVFDMEDKGTTFQSCTDENFWTIRKDHLSVIYPHSTYHQRIHWTNAIRVFYLLERCYPAAMMVHSDFATRNPTHSIPWKSYKLEEIQIFASDMLRANYSALGPWDRLSTELNQRCTIKTMPSIGLNPMCRELMDDRFQRWISGDIDP
eukprot:CAMPEP_0117003982 /NCGR_PEP_ID=MMETSP0472-20121206/5119_1 /TAXON_ID=693140 ORGANISM="Tiarina fusus, Strain LIS" /NCGR_SAMPLE_ID=MMETSP0472 /ASSEMBLY_ACC=CAM_ASM_000603 /LENGTH=350 /DNA_ID=CAMNT_0004704809 /DNA_START=13 /DNA_END=1065 /DNA_ORIENTATION=+